MNPNLKREAGVIGKTGCLSLLIPMLALLVLILSQLACTSGNNINQFIGAIVAPM